MTGVALVVAFGLSLAPGVASRLAAPAWGLDALPWTPLALLPWLALAGLPGRPAREVPASAVVGPLLPVLALALASDLGAGARPAAVLALAAWGALLCAVLAFAARRGGPLHGALWWLTVPLAALLFAARAFVGDLPAAALGASPLVWPLRTIEALEPGAGGGLGMPFGPLAVAALLVLAGGRGRGDGQPQAQGQP